MTTDMAARLLTWLADHWLPLQLGIVAAFAVCAARAAWTCVSGGRG